MSSAASTGCPVACGDALANTAMPPMRLATASASSPEPERCSTRWGSTEPHALTSSKGSLRAHVFQLDRVVEVEQSDGTFKMLDSLADGSLGPEATAVATDEIAALYRAIDELPERTRLVLALPSFSEHDLRASRRRARRDRDAGLSDRAGCRPGAPRDARS